MSSNRPPANSSSHTPNFFTSNKASSSNRILRGTNRHITPTEKKNLKNILIGRLQHYLYFENPHPDYSSLKGKISYELGTSSIGIYGRLQAEKLISVINNFPSSVMDIEVSSKEKLPQQEIEILKNIFVRQKNLVKKTLLPDLKNNLKDIFTIIGNNENLSRGFKTGNEKLTYCLLEGLCSYYNINLLRTLGQEQKDSYPVLTSLYSPVSIKIDSHAIAIREIKKAQAKFERKINQFFEDQAQLNHESQSPAKNLSSLRPR